MKQKQFEYEYTTFGYNYIAFIWSFIASGLSDHEYDRQVMSSCLTQQDMLSVHGVKEEQGYTWLKSDLSRITHQIIGPWEMRL